MELHTYDWERPLLLWAYEARHTQPPQPLTVSSSYPRLDQAYAHCEGLTAWHSRSFTLASQLLPTPKRQSVRALYAFCRTTDDIVDQPNGSPWAALEVWRKRALGETPAGDDPVALAWSDTRARYRIPRRYAEQLIDGVARDLHQVRYDTFADLASYCYGVASTVGLMSMHITGFTRDQAIPYAVKLGVALQLTNILRDVAEDWQRGRLYLPQEELAGFGVTEDHIAQGIIDHRWQALMRFQISRARRLYAEAWPGIGLLAPEGRLAIAAAADFYRAILDRIEASGYDVFSRRAHLSGWQKLWRVPGLWWRTRQFNSSPVVTSMPAWHGLTTCLDE